MAAQNPISRPAVNKPKELAIQINFNPLRSFTEETNEPFSKQKGVSIQSRDHPRDANAIHSFALSPRQPSKKNSSMHRRFSRQKHETSSSQTPHGHSAISNVLELPVLVLASVAFSFSFLPLWMTPDGLSRSPSESPWIVTLLRFSNTKDSGVDRNWNHHGL